MMSGTKYYLTTPVYDAASAPQIGSLYTAILSDAIARHKRMCGFDVAHFMGADAHCVSIEGGEKNADDSQAVSLKRNYGKYEELMALVEVQRTHFDFACSAGNKVAVETLLRRIMRHSRQAIYTGQYEGRYCPHDQIDVSKSAEPADCAKCGRAAELISEERHFFRLSALQNPLLALYEYHPEFIQPQFQLAEIRSVVAKGLKDIPISRKSTERGIPWLDDPGRNVYGWCAELATYLSALGFGQPGHGSDDFGNYWPAKLHVIGKEELLSHAVHWPALLIAADLPLPKHIFAHGALSFSQEGNEKDSFPDAVMRALGSDAARYYLLREAGYGEDSRVDTDGLLKRYNADLVEGLAELAGRILGLIAQHCDGKLPTRSVFGDVDLTVEIASEHTRAAVRFLHDSFNFSGGLKKIWALLGTIDKVMVDNARFESADDPSDKRRFTDALYDACEGLGWVTLLLHPVLPRATKVIWKCLGQTTRLEDQLIDETPWGFLMAGTRIGKLEGLLPGVDSLQALNSPRPGAAAHPGG